MSNLRPQVRSALTSFLTSQDGYHLKTDVLRVIEDEARLMKQTERVFDAFDKDEMGHLGEISRQIEHLKQHVQVTSHDEVRVLDGYVRLEAMVNIAWKQNLMRLFFTYERKRRGDGAADGVHARYSIEYSANYQQRENLLVVEVWSPQDGPSPGRAICINGGVDGLQASESGDDEDIEEDEKRDEKGTDQSNKSHDANDVTPQSNPTPANRASKRQKLCDDASNNQALSKPDEAEKVEGELSPKHDEYLAYLDPDLLHEFLRMTGLEPMEEGTAFFLLMTFPFFEHEWDLVGYVLDEVFGSGEEEEEDEEESKTI